MKKISLFLFSFLFLTLLFLHFTNQAQAIYYEGGYSSYYDTHIHFYDTNSGTSWSVRAKYDANPRSYSVGWTSYYWSDDSTPDIIINNYGPDRSDTVTWYTACVDPETPVSANYNIHSNAYEDFINVSCDSSKTNTVKYRGCGSPNNHGYVGWSAVCPANTSNSCVKAGYVWNCPDACGVGNTSSCTLSRRDCDYPSSSHGDGNCRTTSTINNSTSCGGNCGNTCTTPGVPGGIGSSTTCNSSDDAYIDINWNNVSGANSYDVQWRRAGNSTWNGPYDTNGSSDYRIAANNINNDTTYEYRVRATKTCGGGTNGSWSSVYSRKSAACTPSTPPPSCPSTISASSSCNSGNDAYIDVDWSAVSGATSYDVRWKPSSSTSWNGPYNTTASDYRIGASSINNNTNYDYQVRANNSGGNSGWCPSTVRTIRSNACTVTPTTPPNTRDLIIQSFTFPGGSEGSSVDPTVIIRNQGNTDVTEDFDVRVQAQQNGNGHNLTRRITARIEAGTNEDVSGSFTNMLLGTAGNKTALATVDLRDEVNESSEGNNTATDAYTVTADLANINVNAFNDPTGNCSGTTRVAGSRVSLDGANSQSVAATNPGYTYSNVSNGSHTLRLTPPTNYNMSSCDTSSKTRSVPPDATVNFWVQQEPPDCTSLTTNRNEVTPGQNATLTVNGCPANVNYTWFTDLGNFSGQSNNTVTWNSPNPYFTDTYAYPTVQVCFNGGGACQNLALSNGHSGSNPAGQGIHIAPTFNISGTVFVDVDGNQRISGDSTYSGATTIRICQGSTCNNHNFANGSYNITGLSQGNYTVRYTNVPSGYSVTYPLNGPPPSFSVSVGSPCSENSPDASCANGSISGLNFGITNISSWIQAEGSDIRAFSGAFNNQIPPAPNCGGVTDTYTNRNNPNTNTPGLVYSSGSQDHDSGQVSSRNWQVTGVGYDCNNSKTTYAYIKNIVRNNGITPGTLPGCSTSGSDINCNTASWGSLANGVYEINVPSGTANINGSGYTFPGGRDFVILVNGQLKINEEIHVPTGSTAIFAASGDLTVASGVGAGATSRNTNLEGWYTTQGRLILENTNSCPTPSNRLNVGGAMVACGGFTNQRNLCGENANCPSFYIRERVDFILNAPEFLMPTRRVWQEVAP